MKTATAILENSRLRLRAVEPADSRIMWDIERDSSQWIENGMSAPLSYHSLKEYAERYDADPFNAGQLRLIAETSDSGEYVGIIDLYDISATNRTAFIGIYIIGRYRNRGMGSEAIALIEEYSFRVLNLRQLAAKIVSSNHASRRLFERCGFKLRGVMPEWILSGNTTFDLALFSKQISPESIMQYVTAKET